MSIEERFLKILRGEDKEHFAIVNGHGCIEIYECDKWLKTPIQRGVLPDLTEAIIDMFKKNHVGGIEA